MRKTKVQELHELIDEITVDAEGDDEQLWAFLQAFEDHIPVPCDALVIGEPVQVKKFDYDGNAKRGLTALCQRPTADTKFTISAADVVMPPESPHARYTDAYRQWMGIKPDSTPRPKTARTDARGGRTRSTPAEPRQPPSPGGTAEVAVLSVMQKAAHCRVLPDGETVTLRAQRLWDLVPGEIATIKVAKRWTYAEHPYLSGVIESKRLDVKALGLTPLGLAEWGVWDPAKHYWGEPGDPIRRYARPMIARGPRPQFEMEQIIPGEDPDDPIHDPIIESNDRKESGDTSGAYDLLMGLCRADLRCLDAHSHLGNLSFDNRPEDAIRHYEVGVRIGELSLGEAFNGLLPWVLIDNRPFLRCLHGFGLCLWRLGRVKESAKVFERMLWLNPSDNQGARSLISDVRAGRNWKKDQY